MRLEQFTAISKSMEYVLRFLPPDENVDIYETVFQEDLLGRNKVSERLSSLLENIEDPLVIALNGRWGTGKSYFLKRWVGAHNKQNGGNALTVYFDAFAHDYLSDPLPALIGSLSARAPKKDEPKLDRIKKAAVKFLKPTARVGLALATFGATEALNDLGDAAAEAIKGEASNVIDDFWKKEEGRQAAMEEFRAALVSLTNLESDTIRPLIIVVDELDRCRPDYALEVLETIKHFFSVPHVHFVLGVNLTALENSVKVRYGAGVDASSYLQKFLSFTMRLPDHIGDHERTPSALRYINHLGAEMGTPPHLTEAILNQVKFISFNNHISIRDIGKIMSLVSLIPEEYKNPKVLPGWNIVFTTLVIAKTLRPDFFEKFVDTSLEEEDLNKFFGVHNNINSELKDGSRNPNYDHGLFIIVSAWKFILSNGEVYSDDRYGRELPKLFSRFGDINNPKIIPRKINEEWLNVFSVR